jgi:ubiquinone/menaquinone biosynthesis C-methylase UbiE
VFETRSSEPERIDTGDYTPDEYATYLREIRFINRWIGDRRALEKSLFKKVGELDLDEFSILDVGAGSGELLTEIAAFAEKSDRRAFLVGLDLNELATRSILAEAKDHNAIDPVRGDALRLPFRDAAFDFALCSLFTHHFTDRLVVDVLREMRRVSRRGIFVIDLHRKRWAYRMFKIFCFVFRMSRLVREDGSLSIRKGFVPDELLRLSRAAGLTNAEAHAVFPARVVLTEARRFSTTSFRP